MSPTKSAPLTTATPVDPVPSLVDSDASSSDDEDEEEDDTTKGEVNTDKNPTGKFFVSPMDIDDSTPGNVNPLKLRFTKDTDNMEVVKSKKQQKKERKAAAEKAAAELRK